MSACCAMGSPCGRGRPVPARAQGRTNCHADGRAHGCAHGCAQVEELYSIRLMRHLYRWRDNTTPAEARSGIAFHTAYNPAQLLLTREPLLETRREHPRACRPRGVRGLGKRAAYRR